MGNKIILILFIFIATNVFADEYISKTPSAYSYTSIYDDRYLLIDQSDPQTVVNGKPVFESGIAIYGPTNYLHMTDSNTMKLYIAGTLVHTWSISAAADSFLLLESGDYFLLETGDKLII